MSDVGIEINRCDVLYSKALKIKTCFPIGKFIKVAIPFSSVDLPFEEPSKEIIAPGIVCEVVLSFTMKVMEDCAHKIFV